MLTWTEAHGPALIDENGMPRYWSTVWSQLTHADLKPKTVAKKLGYVESFYQHVDELGGEVDDLLTQLDLTSIRAGLESFFFKLRNVVNGTTAQYERWRATFEFVRDTFVRLHRNPASGVGLEQAVARVEELDKLFMGLWPYQKPPTRMPRALPRKVVIDLLDIVQPGSPRNPFQYENTQWRVFLCVSLLLFHGLRKSELLLLKVDSLRSDRHLTTGETKWRLNIRMNTGDPDSRARKPEIKNSEAIRTIPVTANVAKAILGYHDNYRGAPDHPFLINSHRDSPISLSGLDKAFAKISEYLKPSSREELRDATGALTVQPHALRHTSATIKVKQFTERGDSPEKAMMNMRSYFGWSRSSMMPLLYAKVALDERLNEEWNGNLDERLDAIRLLK